MGHAQSAQRLAASWPAISPNEMKLTVVLVVAAVSATLSSARSTVPTMVYFVNHPLVGSISDEEAAAAVASVNTNLRWVPPTVPEKCYVSDHRAASSPSTATCGTKMPGAPCRTTSIRNTMAADPRARAPSSIVPSPDRPLEMQQPAPFIVQYT